MNRYEALKHAVKAHEAEVDKCGALAVLHPLAVAEAIEARPIPADSNGVLHRRDDYLVVAYLHDVWEDTDYGLLAPLADDQAAALCLITRQPDETYTDYIAGVCSDQIASIVKLADLWHNLSPQRQDCLPVVEAKSLQARYLKARDRIWEALGYEWWPEGGEE